MARGAALQQGGATRILKGAAERLGARRGGMPWLERRHDAGATGRIARALGWFSLGLGLGGVAAPRTMAELSGIGQDDGHRTLMRVVGLREIASGFGILTQPRPASW